MSKNEYDGLADHYQMIESQVQFGDSKASLLVAGNAILLAICGSFAKMLSGCSSDNYNFSCFEPSLSFVLVVLAGFLLIGSVVLALLAARPGGIHRNPPPELYLLSYVASLDKETFIEQYLNTSLDKFYKEALLSIHGKSVFATKKFKLLKWSIDSTLVSLGFLVFSIMFEAVKLLVRQ